MAFPGLDLPKRLISTQHAAVRLLSGPTTTPQLLYTTRQTTQ